MKKAIAILEPVIYAAALAAAYYYLAAPLAEWVHSLDIPQLFSAAGDIYAALLTINTIAAVEIAFFYRLRKLGAANLGLSAPFKVADIIIPAVSAVALGLYWGVTRLFASLSEMPVAHIPAPQTPGDWIVLIILLAVTALGAELLLRGFVVNSLHTKRGLPLWFAGVVSVTVAFIPIAFFPGNALGFAAAAIPITIYYIIRRNFWGSFIAQGVFLTGIVVMAITGMT
jgi:hypothetical protein